ncbi:MAG TPA: DUF742 domain-containing protein [Streptosporangiaceae bacterium]|jgi:hypothetical protein
MSSPDDRWLDQEAGPVVRPYALTGGRTRPSGATFDLICLVSASFGLPMEALDLEPEHEKVLRRCRIPVSVADLASDLDLPLGVIRVLLADLRDRGLVLIHRPAPARLTDPRILREVADGLRRLLSGQGAGGSAAHDQDPHRRRIRCRQDDDGQLGQRDQAAAHRGGPQ